MKEGLQKYFTEFDKLLEELETKIPFSDVVNSKISQASVGWHLEHTLITFNDFIDTLDKSKPEDYKWKFNFIRNIVLITKLIPRGFGKSPKDLLPKTLTTNEQLYNYLAETKKNIKRLEFIPEDRFIVHPVFGQLKLMQTINFLDTHTKHHLKIISDILN